SAGSPTATTPPAPCCGPWTRCRCPSTTTPSSSTSTRPTTPRHPFKVDPSSFHEPRRSSQIVNSWFPHAAKASTRRRRDGRPSLRPEGSASDHAIAPQLGDGRLVVPQFPQDFVGVLP